MLSYFPAWPCRLFSSGILIIYTPHLSGFDVWIMLIGSTSHCRAFNHWVVVAQTWERVGTAVFFWVQVQDEKQQHWKHVITHKKENVLALQSSTLQPTRSLPWVLSASNISRIHFCNFENISFFWVQKVLFLNFPALNKHFWFQFYLTFEFLPTLFKCLWSALWEAHHKQSLLAVCLHRALTKYSDLGLDPNCWVGSKKRRWCH